MDGGEMMYSTDLAQFALMRRWKTTTLGRNKMRRIRMSTTCVVKLHSITVIDISRYRRDYYFHFINKSHTIRYGIHTRGMFACAQKPDG